MAESQTVRVLIAMSGGVDSSVAAALLADQGHDVAGVTLKLWGGASDSGCCSVADVTDAAVVATRLGIPHHVFNLAEEFEKFVVGPYVEDHAQGRTPNPCIECNRHVKFDLLLEATERLGFDALATGHHARIVSGPDGPELHRGDDPGKDQSYVLSMLTKDQLAKILLPIGEMTKEEVRRIAVERNLRTAMKPDSQEVCFIERARGRGEFLSQRIELTPGDLVDETSGQVVGTVPAVELVTVGQKQGLGVDDQGSRRVAVKIEPHSARVVVASEAAASISSLHLEVATRSWVATAPGGATEVLVQMRAHGSVMLGTVDGEEVRLNEPVPPVASGQTVAFYDPHCPTRLLGSARVAS